MPYEFNNVVSPDLHLSGNAHVLGKEEHNSYLMKRTKESLPTNVPGYCNVFISVTLIKEIPALLQGIPPLVTARTRGHAGPPRR